MHRPFEGRISLPGVIGEHNRGRRTMTEVPEDYHPLHAGIKAKLAEIAAASPTPLPWYEAWTRLGPESADQERLAVYRAVRDAGSIPEEAGFFLVAWMLDVLTDERSEEGL